MAGVAVRRWTEAGELIAHVMPFLLLHEDENCVTVGRFNTLALTGNPLPESQLNVSAERDGETVAFMSVTPGYGALLNVTDDGEAVQTLADFVREHVDRLPAFMGQPGIAMPFLERWKAHTGQHWRPAYRELLYRIEAIHDHSLDVPGQMIMADESHLPMLREWHFDFEVEALGKLPPPDRAQYDALKIPDDSRIAGIRLWQGPHGEIVSMAAFKGPTTHGMRIGPVYTPPAQRGHGYGRALTAAVVRELFEVGRRYVLLFADADYAPSNHVYQRIGFRVIGETAQYVLETVPREVQGT
jgi:predicted GNAT family acetyltransferase